MPERARVSGNAVLYERENAHALCAVQDGIPLPRVRVRAHSVREGFARTGRDKPPVRRGTRTRLREDREARRNPWEEVAHAGR